MANLFSPVSVLKGVGAKRQEQLEQLNIRTLYDLIAHFPRDYEDRTQFVTIDQLSVERPLCFKATVTRTPNTHHIRKGLDLTKVSVHDHTARMNMTFFNQPYMTDQLRYGVEYCFYGKLEGDFLGYQVVNPQFEPATNPGVVTGRIFPVYPLTAGISNKLMGALVEQAMEACLAEIPDVLPLELQQEYDLCSVGFAYENIHTPKDLDALETAKKRLIFEEFFLFSLGLSLVREKQSTQYRAPMPPVDLQPFLSALPFSLTQAQTKVTKEVLTDFTLTRPMNRMVQGDVGCGKTMVAACAAYTVCKNGGQVALMAPTEILATQHFATLSRYFEPLGISVTLLTGSLTAKEKRIRKEAIATGQAGLVIGTHALITGDVAFSQLDLVIADEQHRFGVNQRSALAEKGNNPHLLVMSATPIPRSLALVLYGDLDLSIVDGMPPGRQTIDTFLVGENKRARMNGFLRKQVEQGNQAYIICPAIEENEENQLKSAQVWADTLQKAVFPDLSVGLLHGKMTPGEKEEIMGEFAKGNIQILVATTVVEVGVDVPNATMMVIENADRFGLSQLHQLRGRVGRGQDKSYCILFTDNRNTDTITRLKSLCNTNDGFQVAQKDLELRGPGDFFGSRQHGLPLFKVGNLACDMDVLQSAQQAAAKLVESGANFTKNKALMDRIDVLFQKDITLN